jgi:sensor domain CHASE-containing protein/nitrogen-specific signal transduction histidine kinase
VIALIAAIFVVLVLAEVLVERHVVLPSFAELERSDARTAMRRIGKALDLRLNGIAVSATDWGNWADTYRFVLDHNSAFIAANISKLALRELNVNALLIVDLDGRLVQSNDLDLKTDQPLGLDLKVWRALPPDFPWRANLRSGKAAQGMLRTNRGILMLAAAPVLDGNGAGPTRGMVIMGRLLTPAEVRAIGIEAQADLTMLPLPASSGGTTDLVETDAVTQVYRGFSDLYGQPIMSLRVDVPRRITAQGQQAVAFASTCLVIAAVIVLILLVFVLNRVVLEPLATVTRHAVELGENEDLTTRLDLKRGDEFGVLAREFDRMVERVAASRTQLVDQSYEAGFAELAKGVLHNLGNAMTPISVRLASLTERLRAAPAQDAEQAVSELKEQVADPERRADLEEFLRLACQELAQTVRAAQDDVVTITRQTGVIQGVLAEQLRSARNEHVIEPVRLTELVAQSLEIVPDSCRQRLRVDADETLRRVGVVRVARTVLRLVLQNLIINAADAVRDAGKERGTLRVRAEILRDAERQQLHLHCEDDGVGIAPQHLERVFEKGFSTKSPETNHGIGLHWCANAIGALGGRIWAASDGPGHGASMHFVVPLATRETAPLAGAA